MSSKTSSKTCEKCVNFLPAEFRRNVAEFAQMLNINISGFENLLSFLTHESYLLVNAKILTKQYQSNEKLAFLGKWFIFLD